MKPQGLRGFANRLYDIHPKVLLAFLILIYPFALAILSIIEGLAGVVKGARNAHWEIIWLIREIQRPIRPAVRPVTSLLTK